MFHDPDSKLIPYNYASASPEVKELAATVATALSPSPLANSPIHNSPTPNSNSNYFTVIARNLSRENKYVKSVTLNGKPVTDWKIRHADIMSGGELVFEMKARPPIAF